MAKLKVGELYCIKTTGEKVYLLSIVDSDNIQVRRPITTESGVDAHMIENLVPGEIETIKDYLERQVNEMILKGNSQKSLVLAELQFNKEIEKAREEDERVINFPTAGNGTIQ